MNLLRWLKLDYKDKCGEDLPGEWTIEYVDDSPTQTNTIDCAIFAIMTVWYKTLGRDLNFSQENMNTFRERIALEFFLEAKRAQDDNDIVIVVDNDDV